MAHIILLHIKDGRANCYSLGLVELPGCYMKEFKVSCHNMARILGFRV